MTPARRRAALQLQRKRRLKSSRPKPSLFSDPAIQTAFLRIGATWIDKYVPGAKATMDAAIAEAKRPQVAAPAAAEVHELKQRADGVYE